MKPTSCMFWYAVRAKRFDRGANNGKGGYVPLLDQNEKQVFNDNYLSFLQVISFFWENVEQRDGTMKLMLNVFLNGGSVSTDRDTGEQRMKPGYTQVFNELLGKKFCAQFFEWSTRFGIGTSETVARSFVSERSEAPRRSGRSQGRHIHDDDFLDPESADDGPVAVIE